jgi:hypothetical protein
MYPKYSVKMIASPFLSVKMDKKISKKNITQNSKNKNTFK